MEFQYILTTIKLCLVFHSILRDEYTCCWPNSAELIFTTLFNDPTNALQYLTIFFGTQTDSTFSKEQCDIDDARNMHHRQYTEDLLFELELFRENCLLPNYFLNILKYKCLKQDKNGIIQIYRFFDNQMLPGKTFTVIRQLILLEKILHLGKSSRFIQNQLDTTMLQVQLQSLVYGCRQIVFANELTFFDRTMLNYTVPLSNLERRITNLDEMDHLLKATHDMKRVLITLLHACSFCWARWLDARNNSIWLPKHKSIILNRY